jgi:hypothetical protein
MEPTVAIGHIWFSIEHEGLALLVYKLTIKDATDVVTRP